MHPVYAVAPALLLAAACSSVPPVKISYYQAKAKIDVEVTETLTCKEAGSAFSVAVIPTVSKSYVADYGRAPIPFDVSQLEGTFGAFANTDLTFEFYEDGRLKGINQSATGQGGTIVKSAVVLATTLVAVGGGGKPNKDGNATDNSKPVCDIVRGRNRGTSVSMSYKLAVDPARTDKQRLKTDKETASLADKLKKSTEKPALGDYQVQVVLKPLPAILDELPPETAKKYATLLLQKQDSARLTLLASAEKILEQDTTVPNAATYSIPIPRAALFGSQKFELSLRDSGGIEKIKYGKDSGVSDAAGAANSVAATQTPSTAAEEAAATKAEADLIYQKTRLAACRTSPDSCE